MKNNRKGFTIVELVIVIAVIAILAAVLVPTFSGVVQKAQESAAMQQVASAYKEALALALSDDGVIEDGDQETANDFTFVFSNNGADATVTAPQDFGFSSVAISGGKVVLGDPDNDDDQAAERADLKVLSQNLRHADDGDGNNVAERFPRFKKLIEEYKPDLIGTQEGKSNWIDLLETLDEYAIIGCSRAGENATKDDEWNAILYKTERFEDRNNSGTFWLTDPPDTPGTIIPNLTYNYRICTWSVLLDKLTGETVVFANTHLEDDFEVSDQPNTVRTNQVGYLLTNLKQYVGEYYDKCTIYLTGDLNCEPGTDPYQAIIGGGFVDSETNTKNVTEDGVNITFHNYWANDPKDPPSKIDFCFYKGNNVTALEYEIITKQYEGEDDTEPGYVSDHYGVIATFQNDKSN